MARSIRRPCSFCASTPNHDFHPSPPKGLPLPKSGYWRDLPRNAPRWFLLVFRQLRVEHNGELQTPAYSDVTGSPFSKISLLAVAFLALTATAAAQTRVYDLPNGGSVGTYYEVSTVSIPSGSRTTVAPLPMFTPRDPYTTPVYVIDADLGVYIFCGSGGSWSQLQSAYNDILDLLSDSTLTTSGGSGPDTPSPEDDPSALRIELVSVDTTNGFANLLLHGTIPTNGYQLEFKTNLNQVDWTLVADKIRSC